MLSSLLYCKGFCPGRWANTMAFIGEIARQGIIHLYSSSAVSPVLEGFPPDFLFSHKLTSSDMSQRHPSRLKKKKKILGEIPHCQLTSLPFRYANKLNSFLVPGLQQLVHERNVRPRRRLPESRGTLVKSRSPRELGPHCYCWYISSFPASAHCASLCVNPHPSWCGGCHPLEGAGNVNDCFKNIHKEDKDWEGKKTTFF